MDWVRLSSAIERNRTPDFQWVRFPNKSNPIEPNQSDWVRLGSVTELIRTQLNGLRSIGSGKPIHTKQTFRKQGFLAFFNSLFNNRNPCPHLREQNRTEQKYRNSYKFWFPRFSNWSYSRFISVASVPGSFESRKNIFTYQVIEAFTGHREETSSRWRWPNCPRSFTIRNVRPFSPTFFKTLKTSPSLTSKQHSW